MTSDQTPDFAKVPLSKQVAAQLRDYGRLGGWTLTPAEIAEAQALAPHVEQMLRPYDALAERAMQVAQRSGDRRAVVRQLMADGMDPGSAEKIGGMMMQFCQAEGERED